MSGGRRGIRRPIRGAGNLEETNPRRGAAIGQAHHRAGANAPPRGAKPRSRGLRVWTADRKVQPSVRRATAGGLHRSTRTVRCAEREAPERDRSWTRLGDATSPGARLRRKPSRGCESPRTERSGGWDPPREWTRAGDVAKRARTQAVSPDRKVTGGGEREGALKRRYVYEGSNRVRQCPVDGRDDTDGSRHGNRPRASTRRTQWAAALSTHKTFEPAVPNLKRDCDLVR